MDHSWVAVIPFFPSPPTNVRPCIGIPPLETAELFERSHRYLNYIPFFFGQVTFPPYQLSNLAQRATAQTAVPTK